jgi:hypothetical protein
MNELEWLAERRPETEEPTAAGTTRARAALLEHARTPSPVPPRRHTPSPAQLAGVKRRRRILAGAALAATAGIGVLALAPASKDGTAGPVAHTLGIAPQPAQAAPLMKLAAKIRQAPKPVGDATLVLRSHHFPSGGEKDFTGADLYLDGGAYYYGTTLDELKANAKADPTDQEGYEAAKAERDAAVAANTLSGAGARAKMISATLAPDNSAPKLTAAEKADAAKAEATAMAEKLAAARKAGIKPAPPASRQSLDDNRVWLGAMDALIEGAGDPQVRSGVMALMSTMPDVVKVTQGDGSLTITQTDFPRGYTEALVVDDKTGVITKMIGGTAGKTPDVVVDYDIERVTASDVIG